MAAAVIDREHDGCTNAERADISDTQVAQNSTAPAKYT
jgi:hypothetical protein